MKALKLFGTYISKGDTRHVILNWDFICDNDFLEEFIIEKSSDNITFHMIGRENKIRQPERNFFYLFTDTNLNNGINYYRIFLKKKGASKTAILRSNILIIKIPEKKIHIETINKQVFESELILQ